MPKKHKDSKEPSFIKHPEAKGLLVICLCLCMLTSLISFVYKEPSSNFFGLIGYYLALGFQFSFGLGSYFIMLFGLWIGWKLLTEESVPSLISKSSYFALFLVSSCILLNLFAEQQGVSNPLLSKQVYSENFTLTAPYLQLFTRYNLGGVLFYYLLKDLPTYNLKNLLSSIGCSITFSILAFVSLVLLSEISVLSFFRSIYQGFKGLRKFGKTFVDSFKPLPFKNSSQRLSYKVIEKALSSYGNEPSFLKQRKMSYQTIEEETFDSPEEEIEEELLIEPEAKQEKLTTNKISVSTYEEAETLAEKKPSKNILSTLKKKARKKSHKMPPSSLLTSAKKIDKPSLKRELRRQAEVLEETLASFGIEAKVGQVNCGPTIASFEVHPAIGVKVQKIKTLEDDIALNLQAKSIRIIAPIPGKAAVGVEIPSIYPQEVGFKEMLHRYQQQRKKYAIPVLLGKTVTGEDVTCDLTKMPHCIIAGATGSGKSVCINTIVISILMNCHPDDVKLLLVDPKKVELSCYSELPHMIAPVITEAHGAYAALQWLVKEMLYRYEVFKLLGVRNIKSFNERKIDSEREENLDLEVPEKMHYIVTVIDEFADLMMASSTDLETPIARIAQMARAVGIHLVLATQRPSREVITGLIKANFPTRISFKVSSRVNSQIILDENGAETLLGNGDLLFMPPGSSLLTRAQGAYIRDEDINKVVDFHCSQSPPDYLIKSFDQMSKDDFLAEEQDTPRDALYEKALSVVVSARSASTTFLQRKLKIGYARAASLMDELEERGIIGPQEGSKPRKVLKNPHMLQDSSNLDEI